jgi:hypothetical protein
MFNNRRLYLVITLVATMLLSHGKVHAEDKDEYLFRLKERLEQTKQRRKPINALLKQANVLNDVRLSLLKQGREEEADAKGKELDKKLTEIEEKKKEFIEKLRQDLPEREKYLGEEIRHSLEKIAVLKSVLGDFNLLADNQEEALPYYNESSVYYVETLAISKKLYGENSGETKRAKSALNLVEEHIRKLEQ